MSDPLHDLETRVPELTLDRSEPARAAAALDGAGFPGELPSAVARPAGAQQLQDLVRAAADLGLALQPISSAPPHHRGDTRCTTATVVVDLSQRRRVLHVDRRNRVALFEAGVDFAALAGALRAQGLKPLLPLAPRPGKSALAAYLEREPTIHPRYQWDLADPLLCTEVVFGTGELFRTGGAAGPGSVDEQWAAGDAQTNPMGPGQSDLMRVVQGAQGTIGIVTWCSAKAQPLAGEQVEVRAADDLEPLVRVAYGLLRRGHADILLLLDGAALAALLAADRQAFEAGSRRARAWYLVYSVAEPRYFASDKLRWVRREVDELCGAHGVAVAPLPLGDAGALARRLTRPDLTADLPYWRYAGCDRVREIPFLTTLDRAARFVAIARHAARAAGLGAYDLLTYVQPLIGGRCCHVELDFPFSGADALARARVDALTGALAAELADAGAFFSRPYGPLADVALRRSSSARLIPTVQRIFDPHGVLAPHNLRVPPSASPRAAVARDGGPHAD